MDIENYSNEEFLNELKTRLIDGELNQEDVFNVINTFDDYKNDEKLIQNANDLLDVCGHYDTHLYEWTKMPLVLQEIMSENNLVKDSNFKVCTFVDSESKTVSFFHPSDYNVWNIMTLNQVSLLKVVYQSSFVLVNNWIMKNRYGHSDKWIDKERIKELRKEIKHVQ